MTELDGVREAATRQRSAHARRRGRCIQVPGDASRAPLSRRGFTSHRLNRLITLSPLSSLVAVATGADREPIPDKLVVLTFDDASKSHYTVARPLLKKHKFGATFFVTEGWDFATNKKDYMTWDEIAQLHKDGFEIGNHTLDHKARHRQDASATCRPRCEAINARCKEHGIPQPVSFAYPGNAITKDALPVLKDLGIKFARRGGSPEYPYKEGRGFAYEPGLDHPLLVPTAGDARPDLDARRPQGGRRAGEARQDRGAPVPRRAGHRPRLGEHARRSSSRRS